MVAAAFGDARDERVEHQLLHRFVPGEGIVVMRRQEGEVCGRTVGVDDDRRRKAAIDRQDRALARTRKSNLGTRVVEHHQLLVRQRLAVLAKQFEFERDHHRLLVRLAGRGGHVLGQRDDHAVAVGIGFDRGGDPWSASLRIPEAELGEVAARGFLHASDEILAGRCRPVEAIEVEIGGGAEVFLAQHRRHHADQLRALVVDGGGVEIADLDIGFGADRMRQRAAVFWELRGAQRAHILDPLDRRRPLIGAELLVAIDGEALFQAELEPVAAGDAVARPIVEIFVGDHRGDRVVIIIGGGVGIGEDVAAVEDVQPLILHRAEVEIVDRDDVEHVEIIFAAIDLLVPRHRGLERVHRVVGARQIGLADPDAEPDFAARPGDEGRAVFRQVPRDQREQIAGFWERVVPFGPMPAAVQIARANRIAIGEQYRVARLVGGHFHPVAGKHIGAIGEKGDATESFRLALGA